MRILFALLFAACSLSAFEVKAQETGGKDNWVAAGRQVINYLVDKHVNYNMIHDARDFGLPAPDSLTLKTADGFEIFASQRRGDLSLGNRESLGDCLLWSCGGVY